MANTLHHPDCNINFGHSCDLDCEEMMDSPPAKPSERTFTCNTCSTSGSMRWMNDHPCETISQLGEQGGKCEDYPCCGHTDGDGCTPRESHTSAYWVDRMADLMDRGYDDYEIDMMFNRED